MKPMLSSVAKLALAIHILIAASCSSAPRGSDPSKPKAVEFSHPDRTGVIESADKNIVNSSFVADFRLVCKRIEMSLNFNCKVLNVDGSLVGFRDDEIEWFQIGIDLARKELAIDKSGTTDVMFGWNIMLSAEWEGHLEVLIKRDNASLKAYLNTKAN